MDVLMQRMTPPLREETAGSLEDTLGDVDQVPEDSSATSLDSGEDTGPEQGGTPEDAAGESGASGASGSV